MKLDKRLLWPAVGLAAFAVAVRLLFLSQWADTPLFEIEIGDGRGYAAWARAVAAGDVLGHEIFYQAPLYPYFLALVYTLFGDGPWAPRLVQAVLGGSGCLLLALAGTRFFSRRVGLVAGGLLALYAPAIWFDGLLQKASLALFLSCLLLALLGELHARARPGLAVGAGATLGALALTRENTLLLLPWTALWLWLGFGSAARTREARWVGALLLGAALLLLPVGLRNLAVGGQFLITTSQAGPNFYIGNNPDANGRYVPLVRARGSSRYERQDAHALAEKLAGRPLNPAQVSSFWRDRALAWIAKAPGAWLRLMAWKAYLVVHASEGVDTDSFAAQRDASPLLDALAHVFHFGVMLPLGLVGLWLTRSRWRELWVLHGMLFGLAASIALFYVLARYRAPLLPVLLLFSAAGLVGVVDALHARRWSQVAAAAGIAAVSFVACNVPLPRGIDPRAITGYAVGLGLIEQGRNQEAVRELNHVVALAPDFVPAQVLLGQAHLVLDEDPAARQAFEAALRADPEQPDALNGLGGIELAEKHLDAAIDLFERAVDQRPDNPNLISNLAAATAQRGDLVSALALFDRVLSLDPDHVLAALNRASTLERLGRDREALAAYRQALDLPPGRLAPEMRSLVEAAIARLEARVTP